MKHFLRIRMRAHLVAVVATALVVLVAPSSAHAGFKWGGGLYPQAVKNSSGTVVAWDINCYEPLTEPNTQYPVATAYGIGYLRLWRDMRTKRLNTPDRSWVDAYMYNFYLNDLAQFRATGHHCDGSTFLRYFWSVN